MDVNDKDQLLKYTVARLSEAPQLVKNQLEGGKGVLRYRRAYFRVKKYVDDFLLGEKLGDINKRLVILPGLRGVGKTTIVSRSMII